ncbi:MAG TPA: aquaporin [Gemmataceae bacterium]|nr:aquaporin [Gemmataceae bacterium]
MEEKNLRAYMAEMIGTFLFVLISAGSQCIASLGGWQPGSVWWQPGVLEVALASGFMYAVALAVTVPISGGYLNPAITITLWVFRRLEGVQASFLVLAQVLGSIVAGAILWLVLPAGEPARMASHLGAPFLNLEYLGAAGSSSLAIALKGIAIELILTLVLVLIVYGTQLDPRAPRWSGNWANRLACLWIGLALVGCTIFGFPLTGAALNPARWLGPALWDWTQHADAFQYHAPYWVGSIAGALAAGWLYTALVLPPEVESRPAVATPAPAARPAVTSSTLFRAKK